MATVLLEPASGQVTGTHTNMPVLITPSAHTNIGTLTLAQAQSVRIYTDAAKTVEIAREVVSADEIWAKVPSLSGTSDLYFDWDGVRSDYAVTDTYGRNAVWSDYEFVMHMDGATDSTGNHSPTAVGGPPIVSGKIGNATDFVNTMDSVPVDRYDIGSDVIPTASGAAFTFQAWMQWSTNGIGIFWDKQSTITSNRFFAAANYDSTLSNGHIGYFINNGSSFGILRQSTNPGLNDGNWHSHAFTRTGSTGGLYIDGTSRTTAGSTVSGSAHTTGHNHRIGGVAAANDFAYDGLIDELRVRHSVLSADWITTEYNNQNNNAAFWDDSIPGGGGGIILPQFIGFAGL